MKRYVLAPGRVISKTDGQRHHITAAQLARLYGVSLDQCLIYRSSRVAGTLRAGLPILTPRADGDYRLPT